LRRRVLVQGFKSSRFKVSRPNLIKTLKSFNRFPPFKTLQSNRVQKHALSLIEGFEVQGFKVKVGGPPRFGNSRNVEMIVISELCEDVMDVIS
jgi:hypothetical protein